MTKKQRPKFNTNCLLEPVGLSQLSRTSNEIMKGIENSPGCEISNLGTILRIYEVWAKKLCPFLDFDEFIDKVS